MPWVGGKTALRRFLKGCFPYSVERYIEVFGGSAAVILSKEPGKFEVYNDLNADLVNLFRCIKERPLSFLRCANCFPINGRLEFQMILDFLSHSEPDFSHVEREIEVAKREFNEEDSEELIKRLEGRAEIYDVERAAAFYKMIRYSYGGGGKSYGSHPINLAHTLENIFAIASRFANVVIECKDFEDLIGQYDRPNSFFYLDPPYVLTEKYYAVGFSMEDHYRLFRCLKNMRGRFLLSYNDCDMVKELYKDYFIVEVSRLNSLAQRSNAGSRFGEVVIANYDINERRRSMPVQMNVFGKECVDYLQDYRDKRLNRHTFYIPLSLRERE